MFFGIYIRVSNEILSFFYVVEEGRGFCRGRRDRSLRNVGIRGVFDFLKEVLFLFLIKLVS